jgi:FkbM family methyltransferase
MMRAVKSLLQRVLPVSSVIRLRALDYGRKCAAERRLLALLCDRAKVSIDIGANVGTLTYYLARHSSHVYAYEPNPELAAKLRRGFGSNVTVVEAALSDAPGSAVLKLPSYHGIEAHALASIAQDFSDADGVREFRVPVRRLDDEALTNVGFVKIDVEQNEEKVLRGGMKLFAAQRPNMLLEVTPRLYSKPLAEFLGDFLQLGYRVYFLYEGRLKPLAEHRLEVHNNTANLGIASKFVTNVVLTNRELATS